ncbi:poly-gamma-glutamate synthesis protein (capsule biosynthesis protein) [Bacillus oleivorans]|uniref:Poly-gamma-glutamate synthesis protein (Capsule biosynthesis protein) n=1 Tax=Bacillus oleivorans TaxID=1448271 RepID=A0A285D5N9_9BACI|nr:CapA family protein [Bacillus oleivorans]SNX74985.1 poly-gamma-glutamate synthesis protein (capsule biosynthesis protein) [Bacillus oleivorans]
MKNIIILTFILLLTFAGLLTFQWVTKQDETLAMETTPVRLHTFAPFIYQEKGYETSVTLGAIGDILIHDWLYEDAFEKGINGSYNFDPMFANITPLLQKPDILLANQESILGGKEIGISNYPLFNSPQEAGDAIIKAGVDIISTANNHTLDKGENGVLSAIQYYESVGLPYVGSYKSFEDQKKLRIIEKNKISIAFLSYTISTNGLPVPDGKEYLVNVVNEEKIRNEIKRAKEAADVVVMSIHWGQEYIRFPNQHQIDLAQFFISEGVDIVFGHHPHVLQPIEWVETEKGETGLVVFSLGNFLSGQMWDYKDIGGLVEVDLVKTFVEGESTVKITDVRFHPTYVFSKYLRDYLVVPLAEAESYGVPNAAALNQEILEHMLPK